MIRGSTPTLTFKIPFDLSIFDRGFVTFKQVADDGSVVSYLDKALSECEINGNKLIVELSQVETLSFVEDIPLKIQIRLVDNLGQAPISDILTEPVFGILKDGVI